MSNQKEIPTSLIPNNSIKNEIIEKGREILNENSFFNDLDKMMSNSEFRDFYGKYFTDFQDIRLILMFMKLYETLEVEYKNHYGEEISSEAVTFIIKEIMCNNTLRKEVVESFDRFSDNKNFNKGIYLLDVLKKNNLMIKDKKNKE
jgi:hypothetical protein